jgi:K+-sensing histidine kinase KdpD
VHTLLLRPRPTGQLHAAVVSVAAVAIVTGAIFALRPVAPVLSLGVLYLFAVLPVAAVWGLRFALPVSIVSMLAFNWFFLPPTHTFRLADSENWVALAVYLATATGVSELAARARRRAAEAERHARDAAESEARRRTEAVEAEALRRSDTVKTAILRSVGHDLRSPITAITTASEVLDGSGESLSDEETKELLGSIRFQVRRLDRLVSNLLDLSRLEAGGVSPLPELWPVEGLVARALEVIGSGNERVDVELPPDTPAVSVDPTHLEHVLVNLLENALKFSGPDARVRLRASRDGAAVVIRVIDDGPGIPSAEQARIFEAFERGGGGDGARGSGLGLAIARGFVEVNGGRLWVESRPGRGSAFALALPAVELPAGVSS